MTNHTLQKQMIQSGAIIAGLSIALGALGAHKLKTLIDEPSIAVFETGVRYQFYHGITILILGGMLRRLNDKTIKNVWYLFMIGVVLFSGSLYVLSCYKLVYFIKSPDYIMWVTGLTPLGGASFILGWGYLAYKGYKFNSNNSSSTSDRAHSSRTKHRFQRVSEEDKQEI